MIISPIVLAIRGVFGRRRRDSAKDGLTLNVHGLFFFFFFFRAYCGMVDGKREKVDVKLKSLFS